MGRPIALIAGLVAILSAVLSLFLEMFGWWNMQLIYDPIIGSTTTTPFWYNAFWGNYNGGSDEFTYFSEESTQMICGVLVCIGGILCMFQKKTAAIIGAVLIFAGIGLWLANFADMAKDLFESWGGDPDDIDLTKFFSGETTFLFWTLTWRVGYGFYMAIGSGLLALVGAAGKD